MIWERKLDIPSIGRWCKEEKLRISVFYSKSVLTSTSKSAISAKF